MSKASRLRDSKRANPHKRQSRPNVLPIDKKLIPFKTAPLMRPVESHNYKSHGKFGGVANET